jgi:hypothetical protein
MQTGYGMTNKYFVLIFCALSIMYFATVIALRIETDEKIQKITANCVVIK